TGSARRVPLMADALGVTLASLMTMPPEVWSSTARRAAELGYRSLWTAETTGPEAFALLAALSAQQPELSLGTGVLALQLRTPMLAVMGASTLQAQAPDVDVHLGVGISSPVVVGHWHGETYGDRPLAQVREYLTLARECLSGEPVTFDGDFYSCRKFRLGVRLGERKPRLVIGALNARMLALAGELADGVLLNYLPASAVPWCVEQVRAGEVAAGRPTGSCTVHAYVHVGVTDLDAARTPAQKDLFSYIVVDSYAQAFRRAGFGDEVDAVRAAHSDRDRDAALAAVSDAMIGAIDIVGDAGHIAASVRAYRDAGVDEPVVMPLPWGPDRAAVVEATLAAAAGA
ncbi:MAG TPA: LLM class F420-dependent oxidoreductase, partial [Microthrixaceae bacterium]|nr:LLM class F420-dependent oxidoreductase [Microthrixaceae bacterium]